MQTSNINDPLLRTDASKRLCKVNAPGDKTLTLIPCNGHSYKWTVIKLLLNERVDQNFQFDRIDTGGQGSK